MHICVHALFSHPLLQKPKCKPTVTSPTGSYTPILHYDSRHLGFTEPEVPDLDEQVELIGGSNLSITR